MRCRGEVTSEGRRNGKYMMIEHKKGQDVVGDEGARGCGR